MFKCNTSDFPPAPRCPDDSDGRPLNNNYANLTTTYSSEFAAVTNGYAAVVVASVGPDFQLDSPPVVLVNCVVTVTCCPVVPYRQVRD